MAGAIPALGSVANTLEDAPPHLLEIVMVADTGGTMQVFYDRGLGVSEADSVNAALAPSPEAHTYQLPIPLGSYRLLRIDPNGRAGRYEVRSMRILNSAGEETLRIPLDEIRAGAQVSLERANGRQRRHRDDARCERSAGAVRTVERAATGARPHGSSSRRHMGHPDGTRRPAAGHPARSQHGSGRCSDRHDRQ